MSVSMMESPPHPFLSAANHGCVAVAAEQSEMLCGVNGRRDETNFHQRVSVHAHC